MTYPLPPLFRDACRKSDHSLQSIIPLGRERTHRSDSHRSDSHRSDSHRSDSHKCDTQTPETGLKMGHDHTDLLEAVLAQRRFDGEL
jgi:hypothetical protein